MTPTAQRQSLLLGVLVIVLGGVLYWQFAPVNEPAAPAPAPSNTPPAVVTANAGRGSAAVGSVAVDDVRLELLMQPEIPLSSASRNPFRFGAAQTVAPARPRPAPVLAPSPVFTPAPAPAPAGPPPPPPIPLRYVGVIDGPGGERRAILSDGRGNVAYGREGDIIEGRYRVLRVGADSAELSYTDGRGRITLRLPGQ